MRRNSFVWLLAVCLWTAPAMLRADSACDANYAQGLIRQGFSYVEAHRWHDAHHVADQLAAYTGNCNDNFKVQNPVAVYSFYFYAYSLHELGDDPHAEEAVAAGLRTLEQLKRQGGYMSLYNSVRPLFVEVQAKIAGGYASLTPPR